MYGVALVAITMVLSIAAGCTQSRNDRGKPSPNVSLDLVIPDSPLNAISDEADIKLIFRNESDRAILLPVEAIVLEQNLFVRLLPPGYRDDPMEGDCCHLGDTIPPFQLPDEQLVVLQPGQSYTFVIRDSLTWLAFAREVYAGQVYDGEWRIRACFSALYPFTSEIPSHLKELPIWDEPVKSSAKEISFQEPVR